MRAPLFNFESTLHQRKEDDRESCRECYSGHFVFGRRPERGQGKAGDVLLGYYVFGNVHLSSLSLEHNRAEHSPLMLVVSESTLRRQRRMIGNTAQGRPLWSWRAVRRSLSWVVWSM